MTTEAPESGVRPMRADALRNRERVLCAAREAFAEGGPEVAVAEIARRAGVGAGTLFRHFPTKRDLLVAVLDVTFESMAGMVEEATALDDPWESVVRVLTVTAEIQARDRTFLQSVGPELYGDEHFVRRNEAMMNAIAALIARAQAAGVVRADLAPEDVPFLVSAVGGTTEHCGGGVIGGVSPELWRRYLGLILDGLRPEGAHELAESAPTREQLLALKAAAHTPCANG
ncbi:TetR/AcrR family transcriptional regulator [Patulibacter minatonensis]|uniref:TetR/AcrR family transcriptional regulator n=1 Tax=Patulibacter minatonensis TaxID=298163 RepID=UPI000688346D|nr:TetR/AcrR family transcriptional regulator [Patulibacter minatonensis]